MNKKSREVLDVFPMVEKNNAAEKGVTLQNKQTKQPYHNTNTHHQKPTIITKKKNKNPQTNQLTVNLTSFAGKEVFLLCYPENKDVLSELYSLKLLLFIQWIYCYSLLNGFILHDYKLLANHTIFQQKWREISTSLYRS